MDFVFGRRMSTVIEGIAGHVGCACAEQRSVEGAWGWRFLSSPGKSERPPLGSRVLRTTSALCHDGEWPHHLVATAEFKVRGRERGIAFPESEEVEPRR
jgi:hypothetical protein